MAESSLTREHVLDSLGYFTDRASYESPFLTKDTKQLMIGCMDPRSESREEPKNKVQTPGGAYGIGNDRQVAYLAHNDIPLDFDDALVQDAGQRRTSSMDIHRDCAFWRIRRTINEEMAFPSDETLSTVSRWVEDIYHREGITTGVMDDLMEAAGVIVETIPVGEQQDDEKNIELVKNLNPDHHKIYEMQGEAKAGAYVVSHVANVVQNQKKRRASHIQAYFDSLGALIGQTGGHGDDIDYGLSIFTKGAAILRSAASRTVITNIYDIPMIEVVPGIYGIEFERIIKPAERSENEIFSN